MKEGKVTDTRRAEVVALWRRASAKLSQEEFISSLQRNHGIQISTRTLRSWCSRFGGARDTQHIDRARQTVEDVLRKVVEAEDRLRGVLADLEAQCAPSTSAGPQPPLLPVTRSTAAASAHAPTPMPHHWGLGLDLLTPR